MSRKYRRMTMADYKSCAWYQNGTCIRYDKSGAPISCADCEDYERRVVFKIEDLPERNEEMSVRKTCKNCKHYHEGFCNYAEKGGVGCLTTEMERWELSDDAKADVLHDAETEHDIPKYKTCKRYINGSCDNARIFADKPGIKFDCSKCKSYRYYKLPTNIPTNTQTEPEHDAVNSPAHYTSGGIECIDCIKAALGENFIGFLIGNVMKYIYRYKDKNGVEDLRKSMKYLEWAIQELENERT
jgi:hypothetical protein